VVAAKLEHPVASWARDGRRHDCRLLRADLMLLTLHKLLDDPRDAAATLPHGAGELPLEVPAITLHKVLERFVAAAHSDDDLLTDDLAIHDFDSSEEVRGVNVLDREVMDLAQVLDSFQDLALNNVMNIRSCLRQ